MEEHALSAWAIEEPNLHCKELYELLDKALHSLNSLTVMLIMRQRLNIHLQELIVAVLRGGNSDPTSLLKEIQEVCGKARKEQTYFDKQHQQFQNHRFEQDEQDILVRFYQRVVDRMNRKVAVYVRYKQHLQFLAGGVKHFSKMRQTVAMPENHGTLLPFVEVGALLAQENQILERLLVELIVSADLISSVDEFNAIQAPNGVGKRRSNNKQNSPTAGRRISTYYQKKVARNSPNLVKEDNGISSQLAAPRGVSVMDLFNKIRSSYTTSEQFYNTINYEPMSEGRDYKPSSLSKHGLSRLGRMGSINELSPFRSRRNSPIQSMLGELSSDGRKQSLNQSAKSTFENQINQVIQQEFRRGTGRNSVRKGLPFFVGTASDIETIEEITAPKAPIIGRSSLTELIDCKQNEVRRESSFKKQHKKVNSVPVARPLKMKKTESSPVKFVQADRRQEHTRHVKLPIPAPPPKVYAQVKTVTLEPERGLGEFGLASLIVARRYQIAQEDEIYHPEEKQLQSTDNIFKTSSNLSQGLSTFHMDPRVTAQVFWAANNNKLREGPRQDIKRDSLIRIPNFLKKFLKNPNTTTTKEKFQDTLGACKNTFSKLGQLPSTTDNRPLPPPKLPPRFQEGFPKIKIYCTRQYKFIS